MAIAIKVNFLQYFDFFTIATEAYKNSQNYISKKILSTLTNQLHDNYIELEKLNLDLEQNLAIYSYDLEATHDNMLEAVENIKLLKSKIKKFNKNDFEFKNLYNQADEIHNSMLMILEKLAYLEIEELKRENVA